jgi:hypothetical protein
VGFDLGVWDADKPPRVAEAHRRYEQLTRGEDPAATPSPRVDAFAEECRRRWPGEQGGAAGPVSTTRTPSGLLAHIEPDEAAMLFGAWAEMAERHGVVMFDPQSGIVVIPSRLSFAAQPPKPGKVGGGLGNLRRRPSRP